MVGEFPNFSLGITQEIEEYFLYDLDHEEEKQFLAAVDLMAVNVTDKVDTVTVEKANKSTEVNKHRFVNQTQELSVKGLLECPVKCFEWKTSAVARSCSCYKLRKSSGCRSSFIKCPAVFQIPVASNEQFVIRLSYWKPAGFHGQQFGRFSRNLIIQTLFFAVFYGLKPNIETLAFL